MPPCTQCGTPFGAGRFCTSCGATPAGATSVQHARVRSGGASTDTAERAAVAVAVPPPAVDLPPSQRFPMYADELDSGTAALPVAAPALEPRLPRSHSRRLPSRRSWTWPSWLPVAALAVATLLVGIAVVTVLTGSSSSPGAAPNTIPDRPANGSSPSGSGTDSSASATSEVAGLARAFAPRTAPAGVDLAGRPVDYEATNLLDGHPATCWRTPGDATGVTLKFTLDQPTRLTKVGLVNGYAKTAYSGGRTFDWYAGDRRVLRATWIFDDGSSVNQTFRSTRALQSMPITPVTTRTVQLQLTAVSAPGTGPSSRDYTALSEVSLVGSAA